MSENQGNEDQVERTTETTTESVQPSEHSDPAEQYEAPQPEVERTTETVTETEPADDSDSSSDE